ncbi:protein phosphatase 1 regulatory subunit 35 [Corythoichthys intestinalis]|uniref:protein phosphatase 1 regulatory subunit 35 n=1 Tax=Corythoichthys intestinalis TaxID=161448 RepID=UPI0025A50D20|nr:protein phosphatase 1 regulatory subunit 35 [Corythoichthys intestinalis]XP_057712564.1 protein phosphatase 1 regulatory subunit 35 [Corythoichthys intestinalis]
MKSGTTFLSPPPSPSVPPIPLSSSPALTLCSELDLSVLASPGPEHPKRHMKKKGGRKRNTKVHCEEPAVVKVISEPQVSLQSLAQPQQPTSNQRRWRDNFHRNQNPNNGATIQSAALNAAAFYDHPDNLEEVELNTTLALRAKMLALQVEEFDTHKAVQETLQKVERKKQINNRATQGINVSLSQTLFSSLVSVDVPDSDLISHAVKEKLVLAPPTRSLDNKAAASPSPHIFFTSDLFRQKPLPLEDERVNSNPVPSPRPGSSTFDLYRRRCRWEATP